MKSNTVYPVYGMKQEDANKTDGQFIIMRQDYITNPIQNPETLTGKLLWFTTESGYSYCHPYSGAKERAEIIVAALNKSDYQRNLEANSGVLLNAVQTALCWITERAGGGELKAVDVVEILEDAVKKIEQ